MREDIAGQSKKDVKGYELRRSPRAMLKISVIIKGNDRHGNQFEEGTETFEVSKYGARIYSRHELQEDSFLKLRLKSQEEWVDFRVAWIGSAENNTMGHVGIEFNQAINSFGVIFPEEDSCTANMG